MSGRPGAQETYSLKEWLGRLSHGLGLRDPDIQAKLGKGLRRLLQVEGKEPTEATAEAVKFFRELLQELNDPRDQLAGRVTLNTPTWKELQGKDLERRQIWLGQGNKADTWSGSTVGDPRPVLRRGTAQDHMRNIVFPHLETEILARWRKTFDEPFPLELRPPPRERRKESPLRALDSTISYVPRPEAEAELLAWLQSEDKLAAVSGDSGTGKSRLVAEVLTDFCKQQKVRLIALDAATPYLLFDTMCDYLKRTPTTGGAAKVKFEFLLTLRQPSSATVVLIDNVPDWASIEELVAAAPRCVITTNADLVPAGQSHHRIKLDGLTLEESAQLTRSLRPQAEDLDVLRLWDAVAGKPQLLVDVLGMGEDMTIDEICDCFDSDSSQIPQIVGKGTRSVEKQYRRYYEVIRADNQPAALFLAVVVYLDQPTVSLDIVREVWARTAGTLGMRVGSPTAEAKLLARMIEERSLLTLDGDYVESHQLTRRIFRSIEHTHKDAIFQALFAGYLDQLTFVRDEDVLVRESLEWVPAVGSALMALSVRELLAKLSPPAMLNVLIATTCAGCYQLADFLSPVVILTRFVTDKSYEDSEASSWWVALDFVRRLFELGAMSRAEYAARLEALADALDVTDPLNLGLHLMLRWEAARTRYEHEEVYLDSEPYIQNVLQHGTEKEQRTRSMFEIMYANAQSFEQLGYSVEATQLYAGYAQDAGPGTSTVLRLRAAADGSRTSSRLRLPTWCDECQQIAQECHRAIVEKTDVVYADALYTLAQAWRHRLDALASTEPPIQAIECFSQAGDLHMASGNIRTAIEVYTETIALLFWSRLTRRGNLVVPGFDNPEHYLLYVYKLAEDVGERHIMYRIAVLSKLQKGLTKGAALDEIDYLLRIGEQAVTHCQDFRTYQQAMLGALMLSVLTHGPDAYITRLREALKRNRQDDQMKEKYWAVGFEFIRVPPNVLLL